MPADKPQAMVRNHYAQYVTPLTNMQMYPVQQLQIEPLICTSCRLICWRTQARALPS